MNSVCTKCQYCRYAIRLSTDWSQEEFDRGERWWACGYILATGVRRPCRAGYPCSAFLFRSPRPPTIRAGVLEGTSFYSWYQRTVKEKSSDPYTPRPGDAIAIIDPGRSYGYIRRIVCDADDTRVYYFSGARGGRAFRRALDLTDRLIIGYQPPAAVPDDPMFVLADGQRKLGLPPSGIFTAETQHALLIALNSGGSLATLWPILLAGLGYAPSDTKRFQMVEELPLTGVADWSTWRRAYQYLQPLKGTST